MDKKPVKTCWRRHGLHQCFKYGNIVGRGITELIREHFFPPDWRLHYHAGKHGQGAKGGCRVDSELKDWIKCQGKPKVMMRHLATYSSYTLSIIKELRKRGLRPIAAQVVVGHVPTRIATAIDLLVCDLQGHLGIWEIKSGYDGTFEAPVSVRMKTPMKHKDCKFLFEDLPANPLNFSYIQLILTWILWTRTYPKKRIPYQNVCVVNVTHNGCKLYPVPPDFGIEVYTQLKCIKLI